MTYQSAREEARRLFAPTPTPKDPMEVEAAAKAKELLDEARHLDAEADGLEVKIAMLRDRARYIRSKAKGYEDRAAASARRRRAAALVARRSAEPESPIAPPTS